jgi:hypothetical protein
MRKGSDEGKFRFADTVKMADRGKCRAEMIMDPNTFLVTTEITGSVVPGEV